MMRGAARRADSGAAVVWSCRAIGGPVGGGPFGAGAGWGRLRNRPGTSTIITMIRAAPVTPVSWVFAPDRSATAVRDPLVLTGNPWNRPAARFAAPIPIISPLPRTSWPVRAANPDAVAIVSASD